MVRSKGGGGLEVNDMHNIHNHTFWQKILTLSLSYDYVTADAIQMMLHKSETHDFFLGGYVGMKQEVKGGVACKKSQQSIISMLDTE